MKIFIKRSLQLIFATIFISVAVSSVCAQGWKKGAKKLPEAFGKKPPLTGTVSVVHPPVTPRVPPTVTGAALPVRTVSNAKLNLSVERKMHKMHVNNSYGNDYVILQKTPITSVEMEQVFQLLSLPEIIRTYDSGIVKSVKVITDFTNLVDSDTPKYLFAEIDDNSLESSLKIMEEGLLAQKKSQDFRSREIAYIVNACRRTDELFFREVNGKLVINVATLTQFKSYDKALLTVGFAMQIKVGGVFQKYVSMLEPSHQPFLEPLRKFVTLRNQQIQESLIQNEGIDSMAEVELQTDVTTSRTAEEIQNLVKNLNANNPLRQTIEEALGIVPTTNTINYTHSKVDTTTQRSAEEISFLIGNLDINNSLRQTMEQALKSATEKGYINPIENSIQQ